jgi:chromosome transmission fidelity protein 1
MIIPEKGNERCPYLPLPAEDIKIIDFRDQILAAPKDIEDLAEVGRMANICPYFSSRRAIPQAEVLDMFLETSFLLISAPASDASL